MQPLQLVELGLVENKVRVAGVFLYEHRAEFPAFNPLLEGGA